jgi:hypothetical protein
VTIRITGAKIQSNLLPAQGGSGMEALISAIIGGICTLMAAVISPLLSRRKAKPMLPEIVEPKAITGYEDLVIQLLIKEEDELNKLWFEYLSDHSDERLEIHLGKIDAFLSKHPDHASGFILKSLVTGAIEVRNKRHFNHSSNKRLLYRINRLRKKWAALWRLHRPPMPTHVSFA